MKKILLLLVVSLGLSQFTKGQVTMTAACDLMGLVVNVSDTNIVDIYHPGHYLTNPSEYNVIDWEITDTQGNIVAEESVIDYHRFAFQPNLPLTDTLNISAHLVNDSAIYEGNPVSCLIEDQLYWTEDYLPSGTLYGRWTFVHENVGEDQNGSIDSCIAIPIVGCGSAALWDPVCGCDGVTYSNSGDAACNSIYDFTGGECNSQGGICTSNSGIQIIEFGFWENPDDPCDIGECTSDGQFLEIVIDCMEQTGMPCNGEWVEVEGQCCSECVESVIANYSCDSISLNPILPLGGVWDDSVLVVDIETYFSNYSIPYAGLMLIDDMGDTIAIETISTAVNVYGISPNTSETRELILVNELVLPFSGELCVVEGLFAGTSNIVCSYPVIWYNMELDQIQNNRQPKLLRMIDILGRDIKIHQSGQLLFYIYDNGRVDKKFLQ
tara:strand:+ start:1249 stop:2562 length:1314 start_codon:yes stop_codon:yes gene_type:complete